MLNQNKNYIFDYFSGNQSFKVFGLKTRNNHRKNDFFVKYNIMESD